MGARRGTIALAAGAAALMIAMVAADARAAPARRGPFGLGVILGEPTGFTAKGFIASPSAIQLHLGFGIGKKGRFLLAGDYLYHFHGLIPPVASAGWMSPYVGIGAHLGFAREDAVFGLRIPVGLSFQIAGAPIEVFLEIVPGVGFLPATDPLVDGGLGARWYF